MPRVRYWCCAECGKHFPRFKDGGLDVRIMPMSPSLANQTISFCSEQCILTLRVRIELLRPSTLPSSVLPVRRLRNGLVDISRWSAEYDKSGLDDFMKEMIPVHRRRGGSITHIRAAVLHSDLYSMLESKHEATV